ncbi:organic cation transporter protein-like [Pectinophora gossypiella]|uniref:organic cation transporter protein-like n=1 Tax=Pectinophora gossypiella TaxID=13191 RepID=UPI00214E6D99|nr:organic cation transporter protein-like [Pectinophora gossypiella]
MNVINMNSQKMTNLDDVLVKFKLSGRYYIQCLTLMSVAFMSNCINCQNYVFVAEKVSYRCKDADYRSESCTNINNGSEVCNEWVYDNPYSFMSEFQLACHEWKRTLVGTVHSCGYMIGLLIVGPLSDRWGRKLTVAVTGTIGGILGISKSFATSYWIYVTLEFMEAAIGNTGSPIFMLSIEIAAVEKRLMVVLITSMGYASGFIAFPLAAWLVPYWRNLLRVLYGPPLLFIFYIFLLDESPRWLLSRGNKDGAVAILEKMAKYDKITIDKDVLENLTYEKNEDITLVQLLKQTITSRTLLKRLLICVVWWIASTFVNYGMQIHSVSLKGNKYINFSFLSIVEVISTIITIYTLSRFRRKKSLILNFLLAGLFCFIQPFIPSNINWLSIIVYMAGKLMSATYFNITYVYTSELFPTYTRNSMHALCSSLGRIGSIIAPQTPLLTVYWHGLPSLVFGLASLLAGMATLFAPDTADDALPDNVTQAEALGKKQKKDPDSLF